MDCEQLVAAEHERIENDIATHVADFVSASLVVILLTSTIYSIVRSRRRPDPYGFWFDPYIPVVLAVLPAGWLYARWMT